MGVFEIEPPLINDNELCCEAIQYTEEEDNARFIYENELWPYTCAAAGL